MATKTGRIYGVRRSTNNGIAKHSLYKAADVCTTGTTTHDGTFGYWYNVTSRGGVYTETNDSAYVDFDISSMPNVLTAKIVFNKIAAVNYVNSRYISISSQYYKLEESSLGLNITSTSFSSGDQAVDLTAQQIQQLNALNSLALKISGYDSGNKSSSATGWFLSGRDDSVINTITGVNRYDAAYVSVEISNQTQANYIEYTYEELDCTVPTITGDNIDNEILVSWQCPKQETYTLNVKNASNNTVATFGGTTAQSYTIPKGTIKEKGTYTFELIVTGNSQMAIKQVENLILSSTDPTITSLEPDNINQNINLPITISWSSTNQSTFRLIIDGKVYTGNTERTIILPPNTLTSGTKAITLEITYIPSWTTNPDDYRKASKTVSFLAYGKPTIPVQDAVTSYRTVTPNLSWDSNIEQEAYQVKIFSSDGLTQIEDSGEVVSTSYSYTVATTLINKTNYIAKIRIRNKYNLWSDYSEKNITISYTEMPKPLISAFSDITNCAIVINFEITGATGFSKNEIWRMEKYGDWKRIAYNMSKKDVYIDYYVKANTEYTYKCRAIDVYGGISESDLVTITTEVNNFRFYNLEDFNNFVELSMEPDVTLTHKRNVAIDLYAGCEAPSIETDEIKYNTYSMSFALDKAALDKLINVIDKSKVILYRDCRGNKSFGNVVTDITPKKERGIDLYTVSFTFSDVSFWESDVYNGSQHAMLLYFDGTWTFDGSQYFSGFRSW